MAKTTITYCGDLRTESAHESGARLETGGRFSPTDLVGVALGSCMLTMMGVAANKLGVDLKGITAEVEKEMGERPRRIVRLIVRIRAPQMVNPEFRTKLEEAALSCPVDASLHPEIKREVDFIWGL